MAGITREVLKRYYDIIKACTCGNKNVQVVTDQEHYIQCYGCGRKGERMQTAEAAVMAWNMEVGG